MICVTIARKRHKMVIAEHQALAQQGAKLVEYRVDWIPGTPDVPRLLKDRPTPVIVTCRRKQDGGLWEGTEDERRTILRTAIIAGADYVDLEDDIAKSVPRYGSTKRIISYHDFETTPDNLEEKWASMAELNADVIKIVTTARSPSDCVRILKLVAWAKKPTVAFCMGEFGTWSRVLCRKFGSPFTYAAFSADRQIAPGMLTYPQMRDLYHYDKINADTKCYAVLGDPIGHSLSPLLHNTAMRQNDINGIYVPIRVTADHFSQALDDLNSLDFQGYSVTIPHKEALLLKYPNCEESVRELGAANTLLRTEQGWKSANTDVDAAIESIQSVLGPYENFEGKHVLILGAGGAARAIAMGMIRRGANVVVSNRTSVRGMALAESVGCRHATWENRGAEIADILINCTPVGMFPNVDASPFQKNWMRDEMVVFDTIYNPENTLLLKDARDHRCKTVSGVEMFVRQAAAQFGLFHGIPVSLEFMKDTLRRGMSAAK